VSALNVLRLLVISAAVAVPIVVFPGESGYRVAKDSLFIVHAIFIAAIAAIAILWKRMPADLRTMRRPAWLLALLVVVWSIVTAAASTNRTLSLFSLVWIVSNVVFFLAVSGTARNRPAGAALWPIIPALANGVFLVLQVTELWNPIIFPGFIEEYELKKLRYTALLGNPNDVGAYFVAPALATLALGIAWRGSKRYALFILAAFFGLSVFLSEALTGMIALLAGLAMLLAMVSRRMVIIGALLVILAGITAVLVFPPLTERLERATIAFERRDFDTLMSGRITPFFAAVALWKERPVLGIGPGTFGWHYLDTKLEVEKKYPHYLAQDVQMYHEVHNDHLQVLAQTGAPGLLLFLAALALLAKQSFGARTADADGAADPRRRFVRLLAMPLAVAFAVESLAAFPLELSSVLCTYLYYAGLCIGWRE
jgi:O-antigen ligase